MNDKTRLAVSASLTVLGILLGFLNINGEVAGLSLGDVLLIAATVVAGLPILKTAIVSLRYKIIGIDLLVSAAMIGATLIGEYWEAAIVAFLFTLGHFLEARALNKARSALKALTDAAPNVAWVERGDSLVEVKPEEIDVGDVAVVRTGQKIPVDGEIIEGEVSVNQATITGESMPVDKVNGDEVYSGSVVESGYLKVRASQVGSSTLFANIIEMVEEAQDKKAKTQAFLEKFSAYYTPAIMVLAIVVYLVTSDIYLALTLLVIACPGALIIATPVSIVAGIGNAAKRGILIKGGESVENADKAKVVVFDKTGTLTEGKPSVVAVKPFGVESAHLLHRAGSAEEFSEHPLGQAIVTYAKETLSDKLVKASSTSVVIGHGIKADIKGKQVLVGSRRLMVDEGVSIPREVEDYMASEEVTGRTAMLAAESGKVIGVISVADTIRTGAKSLISSLAKNSGRRTVMLTGDNRRAAEAISKQLGIDEVYSELLPADKVSHIAKLQAKYGRVVMVGDGVNDAPALAAADVGVAVGGVGKDVAMETADIVLLSGDVSKLDYALSLSRAIVRNMKTNIYFAVGLVVVLLIGVLTKNVIMSFGMLIHVLSVLLVIMNATRLLRYNK